MKAKYRFTKKTVIEGWAKKHPLVMRWLKKLQKREQSAYFFFLFCDWAKLTPAKLLALKADRNKLDAEYLLDKFVTGEPYPQSVTWNCVMAARSFFKHHYKSLEPEAGRIALDRVKALRKPTKEKLHKLWKAAANPRDRALVSFVNSTAIARETLVNLKWHHIEKDWEDADLPHIGIEDKLLKGHGRGRMRSVEQHTFLTREAQEDLKDYKEFWERRTGMKFTDDMNIFWTINKPYQPLSYTDLTTVARALCRRSGVKFGWHDGRRYVQTACEEANINPNWMKKIKGRKVRGEEAPYSRPAIEQLREAFRRAVPHLLFRTVAPRMSEEERRKQTLRDLLRIQLKDNPKELARIENVLAKAKTMQEIDEALEQKKNENEDCQRIVTEKELPNYLDRGWHVVLTLPSGKIVVESNNNNH